MILLIVYLLNVSHEKKNGIFCIFNFAHWSRLFYVVFISIHNAFVTLRTSSARIIRFLSITSSLEEIKNGRLTMSISAAPYHNDIFLYIYIIYIFIHVSLHNIDSENIITRTSRSCVYFTHTDSRLMNQKLYDLVTINVTFIRHLQIF